jgi:hypothetical protein
MNRIIRSKLRLFFQTRGFFVLFSYIVLLLLASMVCDGEEGDSDMMGKKEEAYGEDTCTQEADGEEGDVDIDEAEKADGEEGNSDVGEEADETPVTEVILDLPRRVRFG